MCWSEVVPEPLSVTVVGELVALLTNETVPLAVPLLNGAKVTVTVWLEPAANVNGKLSPLRLKPDPIRLAEETVTAELPVLLSVTALLAELPTTTEPYDSDVGEADRSALTGAVIDTLARALDLSSATLIATTVAVSAVAGAV